MTNAGFGSLRLLALVPHRDVRIPLRHWSALLFSGGLQGAWSFPWAAPLAVLGRPLADAELKNRAAALRSLINLSGGKFTGGPAVVANIADNISILGPALNVTLPDSFFSFEDDMSAKIDTSTLVDMSKKVDAPAFTDVVIRRVSPLVIGSALCDTASPPDAVCPAPELSFRAAALANMCFHQLDEFSFEWEIGKLHWLPRNL